MLHAIHGWSALDASRQLAARLIFGALLLAPAATAHAQTLAWDPSPDASVAGYRVRYGADAAALTRIVDVGNSREFPLASWPRHRPWFFCVEAYTSSRIASRCSEVVVLTPDADQVAAHPLETFTQWTARLAAGTADADPDGDGVSNAAEFAAQTDPLVPNRWLFAEGSTGAFREEIALSNASADAAVVRLRFLRDGLPAVETVTAVAPAARATVNVNEIPGLPASSAGLEVVTEQGSIVAERTMTWRSPEGTRPAHTAKGVAAASKQWFFAEGEARLLDTWFLVANPGVTPAKATFEFMTGAGRRVVRTYDIGADARVTVWANEIPELAGNSFATTVRATRPMVVERAVYFWSGQAGWRGGHVSAGATAPSERWFVAEGRTGPFFDTYLLLGNPDSRPASVTLRYLTPSGLARTDSVQVAAQSRVTIPVDGLEGLDDTDVSIDVAASVPIIVERSMYWPGDATTWREGHNSVALTALGTRWLLADGRWNDGAGTESYVLLANPNSLAATVRLRVLRQWGLPPLTARLTVAANSRQTLRIDDSFGLFSGERFSVDVTSDRPIAVERSMYTSVGGAWTGGSNETATRLR